MTAHRFIEPLDVLFLRGNKLFGDAGAHGEALIPPWPSVAAGALRSRMLVDAGIDATAFGHGQVRAEGALHACLGTLDDPGSFRLRGFSLARRGGNSVEPLLPLPADLVALEDGDGERCHALEPATLPPALAHNYPLPRVPALRAGSQAKPLGNRWLTAAGLRVYLAGRVPDAGTELVASGALWRSDPRLGIALNGGSRTAAEGQLYTAEAIALADGVGFLTAVDGADGLLPEAGLLRLGGDGRGAHVAACTPHWPQPDYAAIARDSRFRLLLTTPALLEAGWLPAPSGAGGEVWFERPGLRARLVCAAVPRAQVVSGWDLARWQPKPAQRAVPAGAVYWFEAGTLDAEALARLATEGLPGADAARRAEGFNNVLIAAWPR